MASTSKQLHPNDKHYSFKNGFYQEHLCTYAFNTLVGDNMPYYYKHIFSNFLEWMILHLNADAVENIEKYMQRCQDCIDAYDHASIDLSDLLDDINETLRKSIQFDKKIINIWNTIKKIMTSIHESDRKEIEEHMRTFFSDHIMKPLTMGEYVEYEDVIIPLIRSEIESIFEKERKKIIDGLNMSIETAYEYFLKESKRPRLKHLTRFDDPEIEYFLRSQINEENIRDYMDKIKRFTESFQLGDMKGITPKIDKLICFNESVRSILKYSDYAICRFREEAFFKTTDYTDFSEFQRRWEKFFPDVELFEEAIILVASKTHYDKICANSASYKKRPPFHDNGIAYVRGAFRDSSCILYHTDIFVPDFYLFGEEF